MESAGYGFVLTQTLGGTGMEKSYSVKLRHIAEAMQLEIAYQAPDYNEKLVEITAVNRPGLQLVGFYEYFDPRRIQVLGIVETTYLLTLPHEEREKSLESLLSRRPVAVVVCHEMQPLPECLTLAEKYGVSIFVTQESTSEFISKLISRLMQELAPRITMHGVLVEVHGEGLLITGESGIGKSETALELVKRGHRLIADDAVEIRRVDHTVLSGSAPEMIRYYMELRGIGVIDARQIFGVGAVKPSTRVTLVIKLEAWDNTKAYDRLGIEEEYTEILGVKVPQTTIPVQPGRNLAVILELAAMNHRQKLMGYNAAARLAAQHDRFVDNGGYEAAEEYPLTEE